MLALAACGDAGGQAAQGDKPQAFQGSEQGPQAGPQGGGAPQSPNGGPQQASENQAQQALQGLYAIRQQQCQSGNTLACQSLGEFPGHSQELAQAGQACRSGNQQACGAFDRLSQRIAKAYAESAQVMQAGEQSAAQMDAWRAQMNANHAGNMARLNAQAAAGQAAHQARQESYAAMNRTWSNSQAAAERNTGRFNDSIYEGTTVNGGGVQTFVPYGSTGYTDGQGNVVMGPEGGEAPPGWQRMNPTHAAPR
ncbi:hypothetical protein [Phenylobacterium sp.]|uniref:hypothetical protein n=1 Tax=Phenylobacterium sp. TaxID=1871053 RepID=UPI00286CB0D0|nr:hypothetical protein [Phenylobacterium sp.]